MKTIFSDKHALQSVEREFYRGGWVEAFEIPAAPNSCWPPSRARAWAP